MQKTAEPTAIGWVVAETPRKTEFDPSVVLFPLSGKVTLAVGAIGTGFTSFNGLIAKARLVLGGGACFSASDIVRLAGDRPGAPTLP